MRKMSFLLLVLVFLLAVTPTFAKEQITYFSQPEKATVFLNNVAAITDSLTLTGDSDVQIVLPDAIFQDTLVVWENGQRVQAYSLSRSTGRLTLNLLTPSASDVREIELAYLASGLSWTPSYDMWLGDDITQTDFVFYAAIQNNAYELDDVDMTLAAGKVDTSGQITPQSAPTANQYIAGYEQSAAPGGGVSPGAVTVQYKYPLGATSSAPGDMLYVKLLEKTLPARRILLWNAQSDNAVTVIFKVTNDSTIALAEGIVRSYQDGLFIGSDFIEFTPINSEGSITVGHMQEVRVDRAESVTYLPDAPSDADNLHEITLTLSNFSQDELSIDVVDYWPPNALDFKFDTEPQRDANNLFRWSFTLMPNETLTVDYSYKTG